MVWCRRELRLPLEDAGTSGRGLRLLNVTCALQRDGQSGMSQRVVGRECCERQRSANRGLQLAGIAQRPHEPVVCLIESLVGSNGGAEGAGGFCGIAIGEQLNALLKQFSGGL